MGKTQKNIDFNFISEKESILLRHAGEAILGISIDQLGDKFVSEIDDYLSTLPDWLKKDYKQIFMIFNMKISGLIFIKRFKNFTNMNTKQKEKFIRNFASSKISLMRSAFFGLKSICAWGYYSQDNVINNYPGKTIGREHETPTFLFGKSPWKAN